MSTAEKYMNRCFELALKGYGFVSPNPLVGCVIVKNGHVVAEGYHKRFGGPHAEVNALSSAGRKARGATLYVNLEPCVHFGKTPPCADTIIEAGISKVIAGSRDPNALVGGKGFEKLKRAGITVHNAILRRQAERLNEKFYSFMKTGLPFVGVKVAQTVDGRLADYRGTSKWITSEASRREAHQIRAGYDAVLVGANTVAIDNPQLTVRFAKGNNPVRVVLDGNLNVTPERRIFNTGASGTILFTSRRAFRKKSSVVRKMHRQGVRVIPLDDGPDLNMQRVLRQLSVLGISSVLVEGGSRTISAFLSARHVNKVHCFVAPTLLGGGVNSFFLKNPRSLRGSIRLNDTQTRILGADLLLEGYPRFS